MATFNGNGGLSIHGDVLNASPEGDESKRGLIEELKRRAKSSMSNRNFPEAIALYTKAIEVCPTDDKNPLAILYANRSLANLSMSANTAALEDANQSIATDRTYLKGQFRKVMALIGLKDYLAAKDLIIKCLEVQPEDPDLLKQMHIVNQKLSEGGSSSSSTTTTTTVPGAKTTVKLATSTASSSVATGASSSSAATTTTTTASKSTAAAVTSVEGDDATASSSENLRGYKLTSDGRKTTFFNNELDETTKALIGNIAPKKLDPATSSVSTTSSVGGSAWNSAGTFESVDHSTWARDRIKTLICEIPETAAAGDGFSAVTIKGSSVKVSGDAETVMLRGKRKQICDFTVEFDWSATADGTILEGQLTVNDVTADKDYEFSCVYPKFSSPKQKDTTTKRINALQAVVKNALDAFFEEFGAK